MPRRPQVNFRLKKPGKDGLSNIVLDFAYQTRRLRYEFGQSINPNDWNSNKQRVKNKQTTTSDGKFALNDMLDNLEHTCLRAYSEGLKNGIPDQSILRTALNNLIDKNQGNPEISNKPTLFSLAERCPAASAYKGTYTYYNYSTTVNNISIYGNLYDWFAVNNPVSVCPVGWHVPNDNDWLTLKYYVIGITLDLTHTNSGGYLKESGTTHWLAPNTNGTNQTGFTALPGVFEIESCFDYFLTYLNII